MNKQKFSDRSYHYASSALITATATSALFMGAAPALTCDNGATRNTVQTYSTRYVVNAIPPRSSRPFRSVTDDIASTYPSAVEAVETVKQYLRFVRQGIWDHNQFAAHQGDENLLYAYNLLSPTFKRELARNFDEFRTDWLVRCNLQYTKHRIALVDQVGDVAVVYAPIEMPGCREANVKYLQLKFDDQKRSWRINAACSHLNEICNLRARRF